MHSLQNKKRLPTTININLKEERSRLDFDQEQLSNVLWGGDENIKKIRYLMDLFANDPILKNSHFFYEMTREEKIEYHYQKLPRIYEMAPEDITYKNVFIYVLMCGTVTISMN